MNSRTQRDLLIALLVIASVLVLTGIGLTGAVASGLYDIGADVPHTKLVTLLLEQLRDRSTKVHSRDIAVPNLDDPTMIAEGAEHYAAMCTGCHLAPGVTESEIRPGLYPEPPNLAVDGIDDPKEAFWIIKHGIKMSGMPAWGRTHDDGAIWNIVAFVSKMPSMTPAAYRALAGAGGGENPHADDHD
jgi:mono/diheme cytochrome c family protein